MNTVIYIVRSGDTLWQIAKKFNTTIDDIMQYNNIPDPDIININQVLRIPQKYENPENIQNNNKTETPYTYIVRSGDTLWQIAKKFNTTIDDIMHYNNISDPDIININQVLKIPQKYENPENIQNDNETAIPYTYIVSNGDTLWQIAKKYGLNVSDIINMNALTDPDMIFPGQMIILKRKNK